MARIGIYASAFVAAFMTFAVTGGMRASEQVVQAEEHQVPAVTPLGADAHIPFANGGNIRDWAPDGTGALYVQDSRGRWFHATLSAPCMNLQGTEKIAFLTRGPDDLDRFSSVSVRGQRCQFATFVTSAGPPKREKADAVPAASSKG